MALSDFLAPALQISSTILSGAGQLARGNAYQAIGQRRQAASEFTAQQLEQDAEASVNAGMRNSAYQAIQGQIVNSLALARAAASGAGASDPTVLNMMAQTSGESAYRQALAMYEGEAQARMDRLKASAARYEGNTDASDAEMAQGQSNMGALSTVLSGGIKSMSMYDKYWSMPDTLQVSAGT